jgi:hypothetical protein
LADE